MRDGQIEELSFTAGSIEGMPAGSIYIVRGEKQILQLRTLLLAFSELCASHPGTMLDLPYFLQKPGLLKRVPHLYLVSRRSGVSPSDLSPQELVGTVLLLEYRIGFLGTGAYASNDRSGHGTLLAAPSDRLRVAGLVSELIMQRGARVIMLSFPGNNTGGSYSDAQVFQLRPENMQRRGVEWARRQRSASAYLPLASTLDATLAGLGHGTRRNMRRYRRRAETELGCTLVPNVIPDSRELLKFNKDCMYAVPKATLRWRLQVMKSLRNPFLMGLKDASGRWLSVVAGRRFGDTSEILWQMNRAGCTSHSLSTVMRSYCIEHEIAAGARRLRLEGGTFDAIHHAFQAECIVDLVVLRSGVKKLLRRFVNHFVPSDNHLAELLKSDELQWRSADEGAPNSSEADYRARDMARADRVLR